jgi:hypothetical protein
MIAHECAFLYRQTRQYCDKLTAPLSLAQLHAITMAHRATLLRLEHLADVAALAGDVKACQSNLSKYMHLWRDAVKGGSHV